MANINVVELLSDPDFIDPMQIIHRSPSINAFGENILTETTVDTVGSIQPKSGREIERLPEALRSSNVHSFWVKGIIRSDGQSQYPDILVFRGSRYSVQMIYDWTNFGNGSGYSEGLAVREAPTL